jgi:hypothetical protein
MAKPILVIQIPAEHPSPEDGERLRKGVLRDTDNEYHILFYINPDLKEFKTDVLNYQGETPINEKELEEQILKLIK